MIGQTIAHYRVSAKLGEGGMGTVYRAMDTKLGREVAIKVLPDVFALDPDRMARFQREAQVLASLNHPNIATIFGMEDRAIVMELIEGPTLADRIERGPIPLEEALPVARQIAEAMETAHEKNLIHRDLKPANVKVTPEGMVKVLDFGLAKLTHLRDAMVDNRESAPTVVQGQSPTLAGVIMGTAEYMSPEQAAGKPVDKRCDIWAFGAVLYEMLTGRRLFAGDTVSHTLAAVLRDRIDLAVIPSPPAIRALIGRCLERDPRRRLRDIGEARVAIESYLANPSPVPESAPAVPQSPLWKVVAGLLALGLGVALWTSWRAPKPEGERPLIHLDFDAAPNGVRSPAIAPDGSRVVFVSLTPAGSHLAVRRLDQTAIVPLAGTEGASFPFFSPDSRSIGFFSGGQLKKLSLDGGAPVVVADAMYPGGAAWGESGVIIAALNQWTSGILHSIPAGGGSPQPVTTANPAINQITPSVLPDGKGLIFGGVESTLNYVHDLRLVRPGQSESRVLLKDAVGARYLQSGHLVFYRQGSIFAVRFDLDKLQLTGEPIRIVDGVAEDEGIPQFDVSNAGSLVYRRGTGAKRIVARFDSSGKVERIVAAPGSYLVPVLSPDGQQLAVDELSGTGGRVLIHDLARGTTKRLTLDDRSQNHSAWTADGQHLVFHGPNGLMSVRADGVGQPEPFSADASLWCDSFSRDGRFAAGSRAISQADAWIAPVERNGSAIRLGKHVVVAGGKGDQVQSAFSPDRRFLTFMSNESGRYEIYVIGIDPEGKPSGGKWQISTQSGYDPIWPAAGGNIFFKDVTGRISVVSYTVKGDSFSADPPRVWSPRVLTKYPDRVFEMTADGKYAIGVLDADSEAPETHIRVVLHFVDEVRRRFGEGPK